VRPASDELETGGPARNLIALGAYFLRLGAFGFGGPIALAGHMQRDLVAERGWVTEQDYRQGLALAQLAPGPLAAQLAMYLGWVRGGVWGATLIGTAFVGPSLLVVMLLAAFYVTYGGLPWMRAAFYGIGAAVIGIITRSAWTLARRTLRGDRFLWALFAVSAVVTAVTESEIVWVFVGSGILTMLVRARPPVPQRAAMALALPVGSWLVAGLAGPASPAVLRQVVTYFARASLVVFGSGLAVVPFLHGGVVQQFHWLTERQFLDAVAVAMITPGPVVITVAFIGYLVAGPLGGLLAALAIFLPVYAIVVLAAPHYRRVAGNRRVRAFVDGVTAAAAGAIAGAVVVLGRRAVVDLTTVLVAVGAFALLIGRPRTPEPLLIGAAGLIGLFSHGLR
jgi:chromate transporter